MLIEFSGLFSCLIIKVPVMNFVHDSPPRLWGASEVCVANFLWLRFAFRSRKALDYFTTVLEVCQQLFLKVFEELCLHSLRMLTVLFASRFAVRAIYYSLKKLLSRTNSHIFWSCIIVLIVSTIIIIKWTVISLSDEKRSRLFICSWIC